MAIVDFVVASFADGLVQAGYRYDDATNEVQAARLINNSTDNVLIRVVNPLGVEKLGLTRGTGTFTVNLTAGQRFLGHRRPKLSVDYYSIHVIWPV